ncbi:MAG: hypothetical protein HZB53_06090 [Chloroflexi bacterium]|nr:hypothetical protein [Chloroflexota bacterium]
MSSALYAAARDVAAGTRTLAAVLARSTGDCEADAACALQLAIVANFTDHLNEAVDVARVVLELTGSDASAEAVLAEAQADATLSDPLLTAHAEFVRGLVAFRSNHHTVSVEQFEKAARLFGDASADLDAAGARQPG